MRYAVVIVHFGDAALTRACLESVRALAADAIGIVVVFNNGSVPPEVDSTDFIAVTPAENMGYAGGANRGVAAAIDRLSADAIWILNNDLTLTTGPQSLLDELHQDPAIAMVGPRILDQASGRIWNDGGTVDLNSGQPLSFRHGKAPEPLEPFDVEFLCGCAPLVRVEAWQAVGGFDERFFLYFEDADLSRRLLDRGWRLRQVPAAQVNHRPSSSTTALGSGHRYYRLRNRLLFLDLHGHRTLAGKKARRRLLLGAYSRVLRCLLTGRREEARALRMAIKDARREHWGRQTP